MTLVPVNTTTGEIARDPQSVVDFLENAKWALDVAVEMTGPAEVALLKTQIVMAETYARELHLSKDIQEQSREMVRRAEYALGRAIRQGQEEGSVATKQQMASWAGKASASQRLGQCQPLDTDLPKPSDFATESELMGARSDGIYALTDGVSPEEFEQALDEAKAEGNLSRANLVRKVRSQANAKPTTRSAKADVLADLAAQGYSSRQMLKALSYTRVGEVRALAREYDITIPADATTGLRVLDHTRMVEQAVTAIENVVTSLGLIDFAEVDPAEADEWAASLTDSLAELRRFHKQIKETTHVH